MIPNEQIEEAASEHALRDAPVSAENWSFRGFKAGAQYTINQLQEQNKELVEALEAAEWFMKQMKKHQENLYISPENTLHHVTVALKKAKQP